MLVIEIEKIFLMRQPRRCATVVASYHVTNDMVWRMSLEMITMVTMLLITDTRSPSAQPSLVADCRAAKGQLIRCATQSAVYILLTAGLQTVPTLLSQSNSACPSKDTPAFSSGTFMHPANCYLVRVQPIKHSKHVILRPEEEKLSRVFRVDLSHTGTSDLILGEFPVNK
ncbi:hypothetical protein J6590_017227 [Homalodisca vitripennis]|nr:hypothetical protein J6590_017227 [Homalodisca vitripennis]